MSIAVYTLRTWGETQTIRYIAELEACCRQLADDSASGRPCNDIRPALYRREQGRHVIFFRRESNGILVSRILHERMLPERHAFNDEDTTH
ncbi:MAG: type II toxin-antitoxin system RelE/ParE family toxin [Acidobacteriota bacterium]|nr:type II toxin-antitoxin system RelE/ParE family toxin [Acidobacteriota bacterium]